MCSDMPSTGGYSTANGVGGRPQPVQCVALPVVDVSEERLGSKQTNTKAVSSYDTEIKGMINLFFKAIGYPIPTIRLNWRDNEDTG